MKEEGPAGQLPGSLRLCARGESDWVLIDMFAFSLWEPKDGYLMPTASYRLKY